MKMLPSALRADLNGDVAHGSLVPSGDGASAIEPIVWASRRCSPVRPRNTARHFSNGRVDSVLMALAMSVSLSCTESVNFPAPTLEWWDSNPDNVGAGYALSEQPLRSSSPYRAGSTSMGPWITTSVTRSRNAVCDGRSFCVVR